jgi:predicted nucleic acid-binding protein
VLSKSNKARALEMIQDISELCEIVEFSNKEVIESCELMVSDKPRYKDLEDTIQLVLAQKAQCQLILSNDKGFVSPEIELMTTKQFVSSTGS